MEEEKSKRLSFQPKAIELCLAHFTPESTKRLWPSIGIDAARFVLGVGYVMEGLRAITGVKYKLQAEACSVRTLHIKHVSCK